MGCRSPAPQAELLRLALDGDAVVPDPARRRPGRGAYLHPRADCVERGLAPRALARAFRRPVRPGRGTVEWIEEWRRSASRT